MTNPRTLIRLLVALGLAGLLAACSDESVADTQLEIKLATDCQGVYESIQVFVDDEFWGTLVPGEDIRREVTEGPHVVRAEPGWSNGFTVEVVGTGLRQTLTCVR